MKTTRVFLAVLLVAGAAVSAFSAAAPRPSQLTLLVAPARVTVMQVAFDTISLRPAVLVSYQGDARSAEPVLHAWTGQEWVYVSMQDFRAVNFLQVTPARAILIGGEELLSPDLVSAVSSWCPQVVSVPELQPSGLVNALGGHLEFTDREWQWMARRYNMNLEDLNAARRQESWYDQSGYRDEWSEGWRVLPSRRRGRPARGAVEQPAPAARGAVPPAQVVDEAAPAQPEDAPADSPAETPAPVMEPRVTIPAAEEPPAEELPVK